jgi:hypothetical protein
MSAKIETAARTALADRIVINLVKIFSRLARGPCDDFDAQKDIFNIGGEF